MSVRLPWLFACSSHILRLEPFIVSVLMSELAYDMFKGHIRTGMFYSLLNWEFSIILYK